MVTQMLKRLLQITAGVFLCALLAGPVQAVTPIEFEIQKLLAVDGAAGDQFGRSVSIDGETALVGAMGDNSFSGSAYVFRWSGTAWVQQAKLTAADGAPSDQFGVSVALDGDTALVGALFDSDNGFASGSAYVYRWNGNAWVQQAKLTAADGAASDLFGYSVALDGDTALVGAPTDDDNGDASGSAYVFRWDSGAWVQQAKLTAADGAPSDQFGSSVALDGDTALVGAHGDNSHSGSAYVFGWDGAWVQQAKLTAADGARLDQFGSSVALDGDTALIGAFSDDDWSGSAYVFSRTGGVWVQQAKLTAADRAASDAFGWSVALDGDTALVGAYLDDDNGGSSGSAYVFSRTGGVWSEMLKLLASDGNLNDLLSYGVSLSGHRVIAGAPHQDSKGTDAGAAYIFELHLDDQAPVVSDVLINPNPVAYNTAFAVTALIDDSATGGSPIASASYSVNGGASVAMAATDGAFDESSESVTATLGAGLAVGVYNVCVSGTDSAANVSQPVCTLLAVYDPSAGFVTGGGWIDSPAGAYAPDASLTGKANFGFVAKYQKGANVPTGQTEFHFQTAGLNFHSEDCQWLVVSGARAQFKGSGTINGVGNYGFMITAIDEVLTDSSDVDLFRIKIWNLDNAGGVVYDNQMGADDSADPSTAIAGGAIVIHKPKGK